MVPTCLRYGLAISNPSVCSATRLRSSSHASVSDTRTVATRNHASRYPVVRGYSSYMGYSNTDVCTTTVRHTDHGVSVSTPLSISTRNEDISCSNEEKETPVPSTGFYRSDDGEGYPSVSFVQDGQDVI